MKILQINRQRTQVSYSGFGISKSKKTAIYEFPNTVNLSVLEIKETDNKKTIKLCLKNFYLLFKTMLNSALEGKELVFNLEIENNTQLDNDNKTPPFPSKPFTNTPTPEQKQEYVDSLLKYIAGNKPSVEDKVRAINEINKYGIDNLDKMIDYLSDDIDDEIIQATLQTFAKWGNQKYANRAICPFLSPESSLTSRSKTYIEALKTIQKLADLSDYTEKEREDLFYRQIRRLLKHSDEKVRAMAQETLDKITPDINKK